MQVATLSQTVMETMNQLERAGVSCVPVVDGEGKCVDVYCKYDLTILVSSNTFSHLDLSIREALQVRPKNSGVVVTCQGKFQPVSSASHTSPS